MSQLYDHYSSAIFYPNSLAGANADEVLALYISYQTEMTDIQPYRQLEYLSYAFAKVDTEGLAGLTRLRHFSCQRSFLSRQCRLLPLLRSNTGLQELQLHEVQLNDDDARTLVTFSQLRYLELTAIELPPLPQDWAQLQQLQHLSLATCGLPEIPPVIAELAQLTHLDLSNNPLTELPSWLLQLPHLTTLDISGCQLTSLPDWLADLPAIKTIEAKGNPFSQLPTSLARLKSRLKIEPVKKALYDEKTRLRLQQKSRQISDFADFGFKLMVVQQLMYDEKLITPAFDIYDFVQQPENAHIDPEGDEAYQVLAEVKTWFEQLAIPEYLLQQISELHADAGDEIYSQLCPQWNGYDDYFAVNSCADKRLLPQLKKIISPFLTEACIAEAQSLGIEADDA
ncbi:leucine-rich repeat domain-containing protein [Bacterioplanoides pacificum]|uniref:Leucine-rich repeat domain-containing protein n=1 Tax=Bacterioplanoides pacificum TaxID=1171596 RepID=A0ABV7W000_9GAMM